MKKNKLYISLAMTWVLAACSPSTTSIQSSGTASVVSAATMDAQEQTDAINQKFNHFKESFIESYWHIAPSHAVYVGYYKFDDQLAIPNEAQRDLENTFAEQQLQSLAAFDVSQLNAVNASDHAILKNHIEALSWYNVELKNYQWDPSVYNVASIFGLILNTDYKALDERLLTLLTRMSNVPAYYQAAIANITSPTIPHTELAIQQNQGALGVFDDAIPAAVSKSTLPTAQKEKILVAAKTSSAAIKEYIAWLENQLIVINKTNTATDFRIGEVLYEQKFALDIYSDLTAKQLYEKALADKRRVHNEIIKITEKLWSKYFQGTTIPDDRLIATKKLIDHISVKHVNREGFVDSIRQQIPQLEAFVAKQNLIEMDEDKPLVVRETPEYQRGYAGASIDAPGPYDAQANTYYNVTPLDDFTAEQAESYLKEYNHWLLQILNIHEAVPGHYTQLVHSNKSPSLVKSLFGNGAMVEGWAVYTERMMLEEGYGEFEPELWLMYYKWNLRVIVNAILDYSVHVKGMTEAQAMNLMMNEAFQEEAEAAGKWRRATLSQVQLTSYFTGYSEIYALREALKTATGSDFNLADFHNQFLSYGSAPVPIIKQLMFESYVTTH